MEEPNEEEKIGDGINGGKPLEDNGNGEVIGTVVGDCRGEAEKETFKYRDHPSTSFYIAYLVILKMESKMSEVW